MESYEMFSIPRAAFPDYSYFSKHADSYHKEAYDFLGHLGREGFSIYSIINVLVAGLWQDSIECSDICEKATPTLQPVTVSQAKELQWDVILFFFDDVMNKQVRPHLRELLQINDEKVLEKTSFINIRHDELTPYEMEENARQLMKVIGEMEPRNVDNTQQTELKVACKKNLKTTINTLLMRQVFERVLTLKEQLNLSLSNLKKTRPNIEITELRNCILGKTNTFGLQLEFEPDPQEGSSMYRNETVEQFHQRHEHSDIAIKCEFCHFLHKVCFAICKCFETKVHSRPMPKSLLGVADHLLREVSEVVVEEISERISSAMLQRRGINIPQVSIFAVTKQVFAIIRCLRSKNVMDKLLRIFKRLETTLFRNTSKLLTRLEWKITGLLIESPLPEYHRFQEDEVGRQQFGKKIQEELRRILPSIKRCGFVEYTFLIEVNEAAYTEQEDAIKSTIESALKDYNIEYEVRPAVQRLLHRSGSKIETDTQQVGTFGTFANIKQTINSTSKIRCSALLSHHVIKGAKSVSVITHDQALNQLGSLIAQGKEPYDIAALEVPDSEKNDYESGFMNAKGNLMERCKIIGLTSHESERMKELIGLRKVFIYGAFSKPGFGVITSTNFGVFGVDEEIIQLILISDLEKDTPFCTEGDSGAIVLAEDPDDEGSVRVIGMLCAKLEDSALAFLFVDGVRSMIDFSHGTDNSISSFGIHGTEIQSTILLK